MLTCRMKPCELYFQFHRLYALVLNIFFIAIPCPLLFKFPALILSTLEISFWVFVDSWLCIFVCDANDGVDQWSGLCRPAPRAPRATRPLPIGQRVVGTDEMLIIVITNGEYTKFWTPNKRKSYKKFCLISCS